MLGERDLRSIIDDPSERNSVSCLELTTALLDRATAYQPLINAFITITPDTALADAQVVDTRRAKRSPSALNGLPIAVKDNVDVLGVRTTAGSQCFRDRRATRDAEVIRRLRAAGAVIIGKTLLHEFAFGVTSDNPFYGACRNPWDLTRVPGGSSGGSAAALAADLCIAALGTDTGGSIRIPAALTGVSGLRPTYGAVSTRGTFPIGRSFDTVGPMARSADDVLRVLRIINGYDPSDARAVNQSLLTPMNRAGMQDIRIGVPSEFFFSDVDPEIEHHVRDALAVLERLGASLVEVSLPGAESAGEACRLMLLAEAFALHKDTYMRNRELLGADTVDRLSVGEKIAGWEYAAALQEMHEWQQTIRRLFQDVALIATPATSTPAPPSGPPETGQARAPSLTLFSYPWSLAHIPAVSIPCGFTSREHLPIGLQLAADGWRDYFVLQAASAYQSVTTWHRERANLPQSPTTPSSRS